MTPKTLSMGKYRALQRASTQDGLFNILALDHQDALRRVLNPQSPATVADSDLTAFKMQAVSLLIDDVSGVLLDPVYGAFQAIEAHNLGSKGLLVELEKADYQMNPMPLDVEIDPDWSVAKIKHMNADGVKLFFYYNPYQRDHAARQEAVVRQVVTECTWLEIPFYAEPIIYHADKSPADIPGGLVAEAARRIAKMGVDVLKLEFPVDVKKEPNPAVWLEACEAITTTIDTPWVLLSAGVPFNVFARQLEVACKAGASGFIVGRALWGDAAMISDPAARQQWFRETGRARMTLLNAIARTYGIPWQNFYRESLPVVTTETFRRYPELDENNG